MSVSHHKSEDSIRSYSHKVKSSKKKEIALALSNFTGMTSTESSSVVRKSVDVTKSTLILHQNSNQDIATKTFFQSSYSSQEMVLDSEDFPLEVEAPSAKRFLCPQLKSFTWDVPAGYFYGINKKQTNYLLCGVPTCFTKSSCVLLKEEFSSFKLLSSCCRVRDFWSYRYCEALSPTLVFFYKKLKISQLKLTHT